MSYSISKTNYFVNASSFGNNRTQRSSIDFGIYEPSTESTTEPSFETRVLEGPQVVFGETTEANRSGRITLPSEIDILQSTGIPQDSSSATTGGARIVLPSESNILESTGLPQSNDTFAEDMVNTLRNLSSARRRTNRASGFASTALGRNRN